MKILLSCILCFFEATLGRKAPDFHVPILPSQELQRHGSSLPNGKSANVVTQSSGAAVNAPSERALAHDGKHPVQLNQEPFDDHGVSWSESKQTQSSALRGTKVVAKDSNVVVDSVSRAELKEDDNPDSGRSGSANATDSSWANFLSSPWATLLPQEPLSPKKDIASAVAEEGPNHNTVRIVDKDFTGSLWYGFGPHIHMEEIFQKGFLSGRHSAGKKSSQTTDSGSHEVEMSVRALDSEFLFIFEILIGLLVYGLIGTFTASFVAKAFHCSWRAAMIANILWPVSVCAAVAPALVQDLKRRKQPNLVFDRFSKANLEKEFRGHYLITPQTISENLHMPLDQASLWHKWFAEDKKELSLERMLVKASGLHSTDGKNICGILFDVNSGGQDGGFSINHAAHVLESWCVQRYGDMCKDGGMDELIQIIMGHLHLQVSDSGNITRAEWMRLSTECPELFDCKAQYPAHVSYLKLLCRVRRDACQLLEVSDRRTT